MDPDPNPRKEIEVDPDPDLDPERGLKWIRPNAVDPGGSGTLILFMMGNEVIKQIECGFIRKRSISFLCTSTSETKHPFCSVFRCGSFS